MKIFHIKQTHRFPISQEEAWRFFSSPKNLAAITPQRMNFNILYASGGSGMYAGQIIRYRITALPLVRVTWVTEIAHAHEPHLFVDTQLVGPFALWHHQHHFKKDGTGVEMTDDVHYALPLGILGRLAGWLFVHRAVNAIFEHRTKTLARIFSTNPAGRG